VGALREKIKKWPLSSQAHPELIEAREIWWGDDRVTDAKALSGDSHRLGMTQ
jgi:hypothetical protein